MLSPRLRATPTATLAALTAALGMLIVPPLAAARRFRIPAAAAQLIVVSSPTYTPPGHLTTLRAYERTGSTGRWQLAFGPWPAEIGYGDLKDRRHEGDGSTPTGVYGFGTTLYGVAPNPGGLHYAYHRLTCGDWWDEDPDSPRYNRFVHVPCGVRPAFAPSSEALWTETLAYAYLAMIRFNLAPTVGGPAAPGSGIFLHSWVGGPTNGCLALHRSQLLAVLRWLKPSAHPVIEIGPAAEIARLRGRVS